MDILMSETCWAHKKWNKTASDIKLVFHSSTVHEHVHEQLAAGSYPVHIQTQPSICNSFLIISFNLRLRLRTTYKFRPKSFCSNGMINPQHVHTRLHTHYRSLPPPLTMKYFKLLLSKITYRFGTFISLLSLQRGERLNATKQSHLKHIYKRWHVSTTFFYYVNIYVGLHVSTIQVVIIRSLIEITGLQKAAHTFWDPN